MQFTFSPDDERFRQEVRAFISEHLPADLARRNRLWGAGELRFFSDYQVWQQRLARQGWGAPHWPVEYGGARWSAIRKHIYMEEIYRADALDMGWQALYMVGPVIIAFGSQQQKARFLPKIYNGEEYWCQGFSEPGSGSDLANLRTRAELAGDEYIVNGQKIWTSDAVHSPWGFFLVRTDPNVKPQRGISFLLVDMKSPGVTIRPIQSIDGGWGLNEVFLENVRVPRENLVGEPGKGWTYAKYLLDKERTASAYLYWNKRELDKAREAARHARIDGVPLIETPEFAHKFARVEMDLAALEWSVLRVLTEEKPVADMNAIVSALKLRGSEMQHHVTELQMDAMGPHALRFFTDAEIEAVQPPVSAAWPEHVLGASQRFLFRRSATIYGGTREVQKNIIAKLAFGL